MPAVNGTTLSDNMPSAPVASKKASKASVETVYQKKTQLEHILLRPDTYIGSVEYVTEQMWVYDRESERIMQREISYVPGLYKIFDEILVNAADNKQRDRSMDMIKVDIDPENNQVSIYNNGKGIPVVMHKGEKMYVPTMIFGHLLTSSNYNDEEQKVTGGRNGYGAKLCNIFSTKFTVETASEEYMLNYKQTWAENMSKASEAKIKNYGGEDFTRVTFSPDLKKFKMESLDEDIVALLSRRAYDIAASTRGVKVYLNGKRIPIKNFKDYVDLYLKDKVDDADNPVKAVYENVNERWEVAVALSDKGFQQMSFVNSIATTKGGRHVDYVTDNIVKNLTETLKKKNKSGVQIKPFQIKNHLWVFVNCLIVNPTFDSQTKENMTLQAKSFGSKCTFSEKYIANIMKCGVVEAVMAWARFKQQAQLQSKCASKKHTKLKGIPKLEDANDAGTKDSSSCTLILTEGDSAKTLAVAGLGVVGRNRYGVFPLRGKLLNVREASHKQILENAEINNIIKILGLQYKKKYETDADMKTLRYGKLMIMTDQDQDGSHIKGLLINFIHHNWPTLLRRPFMEEFITPIVKASKGGREIPFYSLPEFEEWKKSRDNWHTYKIKYYKGLGTSTSKEAKEYFTDMLRHRVIFDYSGAQDDHSIQMAFSKKAVDQRKEWLTGWMEECKRRKELGLPDIYLYEKDTKTVTYTDFVNKELVLFSNLDNERSIPCLVDGLKPGQRKVLYTCLKRNDKREIKVAQLAGSVAEHSAYHHGETSLMSTIINLAQDFVGSNNINLLQPIGQFGTRLQGGKDSASPRYIFTMLSKLTRAIFHIHDEALLKSNYDDNKRIEPEWYIPIIPMVLVNGSEGIGTGWSTKIPNYNPREIVNNLKKMINGEEPERMKPWFKGFKGTVEEIDGQRYVIHGEIADLGNNKLEITELPLRVWTQVYKESVMEPLFVGSDKAPAIITDYKEYHTDTTVRFVVNMTEDKFQKALADGMHKVFKLQGSLTTSTMVLFDHNGVLRKYETVDQILREFFDLRLQYYEKRKAYLVGFLEAEACKLSNQARFILEKCDGSLVIENKKKKDTIAELQRKGYDSDPLKAWKKLQDLNALLEEQLETEMEEEEAENSSGPDYDYLLGMKLWSLTLERKNEILKSRDEKTQELRLLKEKTPSDLWMNDLDTFLEQLDAVEAEERDEAKPKKPRKKKSRDDDDDDDDFEIGKATKKKPKKRGSSNSAADANETRPSAFGERIVPLIDQELKKKFEKAAALKEKEKGKKTKKEARESGEPDEFDELVAANTGKSLASRLGNSPDMIMKKAKAKRSGDGMKQTKLNFKKTSPKKKGRNSSDENSDLSDVSVDFEPRERTTSRRVATKVKYTRDDSSSSSGGEEFHDNVGIEEPDMVVSNSILDDSHAGKGDTVAVSDTDSEFEKNPQKKPKATAPPQDKPSASDLFDSMMTGSSISPPATTSEKAPPRKRVITSMDSSDEEPKPKKKPGPKKTAAAAYSNDISDDEVPKQKKKPIPKKKALAKPAAISDDEDVPKPKKKPGPKKTAAAKKKAADSESDDMFESFSSGKSAKSSEVADVPPPRERPGRQRKAPVVYTLSDDDESDDDY
ncbi:DNA topoisomerase 2-alpha-like isoform X2 [Portunus trituberculatus]|uniref:DNA topoisomerase 2-alpha-like isoform X2 n=1 Tax=Portunus trituberculatus TaxID=210409 RepID=UPI001E1CC1B2|nr:DNA topoisomerase 2-alpha-like isoform X2 [Portunus trituberculatus]